MKQLLIIVIILLVGDRSFSQTWGDSSVLENDIFSAVQESPRFINGAKGFYEFIANNLEISNENRITLMNNVVVVKIVISKSGAVVYGSIEKGINEECNQSILKLVSKMPPWTPAKQNGRPVYCYMTLPIVLL